MPAFFNRLRKGSPFHSVETQADGFVIRPEPGYQPEFDRLAKRALARAGGRYVILPQSNGERGWASLVIVALN